MCQEPRTAGPGRISRSARLSELSLSLSSSLSLGRFSLTAIVLPSRASASRATPCTLPRALDPTLRARSQTPCAAHTATAPRVYYTAHDHTPPSWPRSPDEDRCCPTWSKFLPCYRYAILGASYAVRSSPALVGRSTERSSANAKEAASTRARDGNTISYSYRTSSSRKGSRS